MARQALKVKVWMTKLIISKKYPLGGFISVLCHSAERLWVSQDSEGGKQ